MQISVIIIIFMQIRLLNYYNDVASTQNFIMSHIYIIFFNFQLLQWCNILIMCNNLISIITMIYNIIKLLPLLQLYIYNIIKVQVLVTSMQQLRTGKNYIYIYTIILFNFIKFIWVTLVNKII